MAALNAGAGEAQPVEHRSNSVGLAESSCIPVGNRVCTEQQCQSSEDIVHPGGSQDAGLIDESSPINGPDLRDVRELPGDQLD